MSHFPHLTQSKLVTPSIIVDCMTSYGRESQDQTHHRQARSAGVKIYKTPCRGTDRFTLCYWVDDVRKRQTFDNLAATTWLTSGHRDAPAQAALGQTSAPLSSCRLRSAAPPGLPPRFGHRPPPGSGARPGALSARPAPASLRASLAVPEDRHAWATRCHAAPLVSRRPEKLPAPRSAR